MATWQFDFGLINKNEEITHIKLMEGSLLALQTVLPVGESWSEQLKIYGALDKTCVQLFYDEIGLLEIFCRLDLRNSIRKELEAIIAFANANELIILYEDQEIEPTLENIKDLIKKSNALRFIKDPVEFFENIKHSSQ